MIRHQFSKFITHPKFYKNLIRIGYFVTLLSILWLPFTPTLGEKGFISENAMTPDHPQTVYNGSQFVPQHMENLQNIKIYNENSTIEYIESVFRKLNIEPHRQYLTPQYRSFNINVKLRGINVYGIYSAKRPDPSECNIITFDTNLIHKQGKGKLEIAFALSILETFVANRRKINYMSRDIIFLGYDGRYSAHGYAVKQFLDAYQDHKDHTIQRCGIIRQGLNIKITDDQIDRVGYYYMGLNNRVPDLDFYMNYQKMLQDQLEHQWTIHPHLEYESYFSQILKQYYFKPINKFFRQYLGTSFSNVDLTYSFNGIKNMIFGMPHEAHSHMLEKGIMAVTLHGYQSKKLTMYSYQDFLTRLGRVVEKTNRANMVLQEQLHAATRMYFITDAQSFISLPKFVLTTLSIPICIALQQLRSFYEQKSSDRRLRKALTKQVGMLIALLVTYKGAYIMQYVWNYLTGHEITLCVDSPPTQQFRGYINSVTMGYMLTTCFLYITLKIVLPKLIRMMFSTYDYPKYEYENWKTQHFANCIYIGIVSITFSLSNYGLGIVGMVFIASVFLFIRPLAECSFRSFIGFLIVMGWFVGIGFGIYWLKMTMNTTFVDMATDLFMLHNCNGSDTFPFIIFFIIPAMEFMLQILFFRVTNKKKVK